GRGRVGLGRYHDGRRRGRISSYRFHLHGRRRGANGPLRLGHRVRDAALLGGFDLEPGTALTETHGRSGGERRGFAVGDVLIVERGTVPAPQVFHPPLVVLEVQAGVMGGDHVAAVA